MTNDQLVELRKQILEQATPLLEASDLPAEEKFQLSLQIAQSQGTLDSYARAFRAAQLFDDAGDKLSALLDLLGEVDFAIQSGLDRADATDNHAHTQVDETAEVAAAPAE